MVALRSTPAADQGAGPSDESDDDLFYFDECPIVAHDDSLSIKSEIIRELAEALNGKFRQTQGRATIRAIDVNKSICKACRICKKKITSERKGIYDCVKCGNSSFAYMWQILLRMTMLDAEGESFECTAFSEVGAWISM